MSGNINANEAIAPNRLVKLSAIQEPSSPSFSKMLSLPLPKDSLSIQSRAICRIQNRQAFLNRLDLYAQQIRSLEETGESPENLSYLHGLLSSLSHSLHLKKGIVIDPLTNQKFCTLLSGLLGGGGCCGKEKPTEEKNSSNPTGKNRQETIKEDRQEKIKQLKNRKKRPRRQKALLSCLLHDDRAMMMQYFQWLEQNRLFLFHAMGGMNAHGIESYKEVFDHSVEMLKNLIDSEETILASFLAKHMHATLNQFNQKRDLIDERRKE